MFVYRLASKTNFIVLVKNTIRATNNRNFATSTITADQQLLLCQIKRCFSLRFYDMFFNEYAHHDDDAQDADFGMIVQMANDCVAR